MIQAPINQEPLTLAVCATPPTLWRTQETNPASGASSTPSMHTCFETLRTATPQCRNQGELHRDTRGDGYTSRTLRLNHRGWIGPPSDGQVQFSPVQEAFQVNRKLNSWFGLVWVWLM